LPASAAIKETLVRAIDSRFDPAEREQIHLIMFQTDEGQQVNIEQGNDGTRIAKFVSKESSSYSPSGARFVADRKGEIEDEKPKRRIDKYLLRPSDEGYEATKTITLDDSDRDNTTLEPEELNEKEAKEVLAKIAKLKQVQTYR
jgi:hypothetical protein